MSGINSYFHFNRRERRGLLLLLSLIILTLLLRLCLPFLIVPPMPAAAPGLLPAQQQLQQQQTDHITPANTVSLFPFDPNTIDSTGLRNLGLPEKTTQLFLKWRARGKHFYKKEDMKDLYTLKEADYQRIAPYIRIDPASDKGRDQPYRPYERYPELPPLPDKINLNRADSATLVRLPGIGPYLAAKIIERRRALGGFLGTEQLLELHRFPDSTYRYLQQHLVLSAQDIQPIHLNTVTEERLALHPYIGPRMAGNILLLRKGLGRFEEIVQLRQAPLMNEEKYRKIAPYCIID